MASLYDIGPFRLAPTAGMLTRDGVPVALGARTVAVLSVLVARAGEFIGKAEIMEAVWQGVFVEEGNIAYQMTLLRRALAQAPGGDAWIETLPKRGYRFAGPVVKVETAATQEAAGTSKRSNLREPFTSFIGREAELARIRKMLPKTRLLTLAGIGGIGKTRFALHAAGGLTDSFLDGIWFVDLAPLTDPALVPSAVAQVLGIQEASGKPLVDTLARQLKGSQLLLILDNCEHLLEACARLAEALLGACAGVTILATSREPLQVAGEQTWLLPTLSLPEPDANMDAIAQSEAVQLFVARARQHLLDFALSPAQSRVVAQICIRLDGIALAIELAAARVRSYTIEEIHGRLNDRFALLTGGTRTALPRQQTLRATLDWSHDLLTEEERAVFRHLSVFHGSFTLDAATDVAATDTIGQFAVAELISQLVARSLLVVDTTTSGARYHLLETPRAYAREKLEQAHEKADLERCHAQYYRDYFERAPDDWLRLPDAAWRAAYAHECDNVRAALDWAFGSEGDRDIGIGLCSATGPIWLELSLVPEGRKRFEIADSLIRNTPDPELARLYLWQGMLCGDSSPAESVYAKLRAVEIYRRLGDALGLGFSLVQSALVLPRLDRLAEAQAALDEAYPLLENLNVPRALARHAEVAGYLKMRSGNAPGARPHFESAITLCRKISAQRELLRMLGNYAYLTWALGDLDAALLGYQENIALLRTSAYTTKTMLGFNLSNLAGVHTERGELNAALVALREGLPLMMEMGQAWLDMDHYALRAALAGKIANAARLASYADSMFAAKEVSREPNEVRLRNKLLSVLREKLVPDELDRLLAEGAKLSEEEACQLALEE